MVNRPPSCSEDQQNLLQDTRAKHDIFMQEKAHIQNLLNLAIEEVKLYQAHLGRTESQVCKVGGLIGDIHFRLCEHGVLINPITSTLLPPTPNETAPPIPIPNVTATPLPAPNETVACELSSE